MTDYIEREAVLEAKALLSGLGVLDTKEQLALITSVLQAIEQAPASDVVPVVKGKWLKENTIGVYCSACKDWSPTPKNFCPTCGADMRGESK